MIKSVYFLPHGMQIIPGMEDPYNQDFENLHIKMTQITKLLEEDNSEIVILVTPHGLNLADQFLIYEHNEFLGNYFKIVEDESVVYGDLIETKSWKGDQEFSINFKEYLLKNGINAQGLTQGYADYPLTLAWGETVPLYYLPQTNNVKIVILGLPRSRHEKIYDIQDTLVDLGQLVLQFCKEIPERTALIFSGDLSHTHVDGGPYGFHPSSKTFDKLVERWSREPLRNVFENILELQQTALACGMAGLSMLQGIADKNKLINTFDFYDLPTYFGMIVNHWKLE
ncbi:MAG: DODA-type extradiol aromatic ring-opening family dioxygenase [Candidatus Kariarchaeaceae archaeon]